MNDELLTAKEAAAVFRLKPKTFLARINSGAWKIPKIQVGKSVLFDRSDLMAQVEKLKITEGNNEQI